MAPLFFPSSLISLVFFDVEKGVPWIAVYLFLRRLVVPLINANPTLLPPRVARQDKKYGFPLGGW